MSDEVKEVVEGIGKAFEEFKATNDQRLSELEKKGTTDVVTEEKLQRIEADLDKFEDINQKLTAQASEAKSVNEKLDRLETIVKRPNASYEETEVKAEEKAFTKWLRKGKEGLDEMETKALAVSDDTSAGFLAPPEYVRELIKTVTEVSPLRNIARVRSTTLKSVQMPSRTATFSAVFVAEQGTRSETTGYTTQLEEIPTHELYALVDISEQQLEDSVFNVEAEMQEEFATQFAKAEGTAFISGNGVGKPEGILTNSNISTTNSGSGTALTADGLLTLVHSLKSEYGTQGSFIFNRTTLGAIRKLKDSAGQYVFQAGMMLTAGVPNTILGYPYAEMPDMPDVAGSAKPVAFGDFSRGYMIVDRVALSVLRDPFTQATSGNVRYVARRRVGGQVILAEAIATQTISA
jgi:HK97 family phage major capsid protein